MSTSKGICIFERSGHRGTTTGTIVEQDAKERRLPIAILDDQVIAILDTRSSGEALPQSSIPVYFGTATEYGISDGRCFYAEEALVAVDENRDTALYTIKIDGRPARQNITGHGVQVYWRRRFPDYDVPFFTDTDNWSGQLIEDESTILHTVTIEKQ